MLTNRSLWMCLLVVVGLCAREAAAEQIIGANNFQIISRLTGPGSLNQTSAVGIGGTDLGHMVNHNGKIYFLFGDTFSGDTAAIGGNWRHNTMAWSTDTNPADGITFNDWIKTGSTAKEVIHSGLNNPVTEIPTGAISVNNRIYSWFMSVSAWGAPGQWTINNAGLARWQEGDSAFTVVNNFSFAGNGNFGMVAASARAPQENAQDDYLYVWGTPSGRFGGVKLARTLPANIENRASYQFYDGLINGTPQWTSDEFSGDMVVSSPVGEMSVSYNPAVGAWTMMYFDEVSDKFQIRQSPTPWGSWSSPITIATSLQAPGGLYAPYMNPLYFQDGGKTLYFTMSLWDSYDVYLAKATLVLAPEPASAGLLATVLACAISRRRRIS